MRIEWFTNATAARTAAGRLGLAVVFCFAATAIPAGAQDTKAEHAAAVKEYKNGRLADAFGQFKVLANRGDADAARIGLFMYKYGAALYGRDWDLTPHEVESWARLVSSDDRVAQARP